MWFDRFLSKRLAAAITAIVVAIEAGADPITTSVLIGSVVCTYIAAETARPSGSSND
jgi:hypothetical protein